MIKKKSKKLLAAVLALTCSLTLTSSIVAQAFTPLGIDYETDYFSLEEAHAEAASLRREIVDEGTVLLKNNNDALPIAGNSWVTGLGDAGSNLQSGFEASGMHIQIINAANPDEFTAKDKVRMSNGYNDAAIIVMSGSGGSEGLTSGVVSNEVEDNKFGDEKLSYSHQYPIMGPAKTQGNQGQGGQQGGAAPFSTEGANAMVEYKHVLQVTEDTEDLIIYAAEHFKKVIVIVSAATAMEIRCLQESDLVDAIIWTGTREPSADAFEEIARMISGEVNPSGRLPDNWATDFTSNPSWMNDGNSISFSSAADEGAYEYSISSTKAFRLTKDGAYYTRQQHGANVVNYVYGIKYEEDIYNGYRYYETAAADGVIDYEDSVLYPFGYGLSYTSFEWTYNAKKSDLSAWNSEKMLAGGSFNGTVKIAVDVKNTGSVAGKDVVQIYGHSPYYNGGIEKSEVVLVGFEKTGIIAPGKTETVVIEVQIRDLASFDYTDANGNGKRTYELDKSSDDNPYELRIQRNSHDLVESVKLDNLVNDVIFDKDGYTGNDVEALFSNNDEYNLLGHDPAVEGDDKTLVGEDKMTLLSRKNFEDTYPEMDTAEDMVRSQAYFDFITEFPEYEADNWEDYYKLINGVDTVPKGTTEDTAGFVWSITEVPESWSQMADADAQSKAKEEAGDKWLNFADLRGVAWDDPKWDTLLNELTYEEMVELVSYGAYRTIPLDSIGKVKARYMDGANMVDIETDGVMNWGDVPTTAATWNKDLAYRRGIISANIGMHSSVAEGMDAWYAPAVCTHRSPFGGRNPEYFSEDPFLAGHMAGHLVAGLEERGVMTTIKHYALNENENQRRGVQTYVSEQAAREIYFKPFQIVVQQYGGRCMMTSYNQVGDMASSSNYMFMNKMTRQEWGFNGNSMTDAVAPQSDFFTMDSLIRGGSSLVLSSFYGADAEKFPNCAISGYYDAENNCVKVADGTVSNTQWYWLRTAAKEILFAEVDSRVARNGLDLSGYNNNGEVKDLGTLKQGESVGSSGGKGKGDWGGGNTVDAPKVTYELAEKATKNARNSTTYTLVGGILPDGMELSSSGSVSGTPTKAGVYEFTVKIQCYGWLEETCDYRLTIESAFELEDDITNLTVGDKVDTLLFTDVLKVEDYNESYTYSVVSGSLPSGLTINAEGEIVGTPTVAGIYNATIKLTAVKSSTNHAGLVTITTDEIYHDITIVVSAQEVEAGSKVTVGEDGYLYIDGVKTEITSSAGSEVKVGEDGYLYIDGVKTEITANVASATSGCGGYVGVGATLAILAAAGVVYATKKRK